VIFLDNCI